MQTNIRPYPISALKLVLDQHPLKVPPTTPVLDVIAQMHPSDRPTALAVAPVDSALVIENSQLIGRFTAQDVIRLLSSNLNLPSLTVGEVVTPPPITLKQTAILDLLSILTILQQHQVDYLPITDEQDQLIGIVTRDRIYQHLLSLPGDREPPSLNVSPLTPLGSNRLEPIDLAFQRAKYELESLFAERTAALKQTSDEFIAELVHHRHTEAELFRTTAELQAIFQAFPDLYLHLDTDGTILDYQAGRAADFHIPCEKLLHQRIQEVLPTEAEQQFETAIRQVLDTQSPVAIEYSLTMDEEIKHFEARIVPFLCQQVLVIIRNISDRKWAETALRQSEATKRILLDNIPDLIIRMTRSGDYLDFLPAKDFKMLMPSANMQGRNIYEIMSPALAQQRMNYIEQALRTGETQIYEYELTIDGQIQAEEARVAVSGEDEVLVIIRDITARKQAEQALKAQQEFLRHVIDTAPNLIFVKDQQGKFTLANQALANIYGTTVENLIGKTDADFNPNLAEVEQFLVEDQKVVTLQQETLIPEETVTDANGNIYWFQTIKKPLISTDGKAHQILGVATEITARKRAEAALQTLNEELELKVAERTQALELANQQLRIEVIERQQSESALRLFDRAIKASSNGIVITDARLPNLPITYVNPAFERITGYSASEVIGHNCKFLQGSQTDPIAIEAIQRAIQTKTDCTTILRNYRKGGTPFWNELSIAPIYDPEGELTHFVGIQTDITERCQIEEALQQQLAAIEAATDGIGILDASGNFIYLNNAYIRLFGYGNVNDLIGQSWRHLYYQDEIQKLAEDVLPNLKQRHHWQGELIGRRQDGSTFPQEVSFTLIANNGLICVSRDITERKQTENQIKASLREKEVLLQEIHHRVKNNLQVISSLLKLQAGYIQDGQVLDIFKESQNRVKAMALLHEKLYQSKDLANINFSEYIHALVANLFRSYGVRSRTITANLKIETISLNIDTVIPCGLIINELVSNSLKYAFPGGSQGVISIRLEHHPSGSQELVVSDNGIGIPESIDPRNTKSLGLQLVYLLTEQLEGTVEFDRHPGTLFRITLHRSNLTGQK